MTKLRETKACRRAAWLMLLACAAFAAAADTSRAQSGRRSPTMSKGSPAPTAKESTGAESPAVPKKDAKPLAAFILLEDAGTVFEVDYTARRIVLASFAEQLDRSSVVKVSRGGRATRKEARDRAKAEKESFVVLVELEEESPGVSVRAGSRQEDRTLSIKTYVYTPATGDLKFTDRFVARPYGSRATVGGVRVPTTSRYPADAQLEQAGRDAAQRLLTRFQISLPPEPR